MQAAKAMVRLHVCAGLSEPLVLADAISTKILSAGSHQLCYCCASRSPDKNALSKINFLISQPKLMFRYSKSRLNEMFL